MLKLTCQVKLSKFKCHQDASSYKREHFRVLAFFKSIYVQIGK